MKLTDQQIQKRTVRLDKMIPNFLAFCFYVDAGINVHVLIDIDLFTYCNSLEFHSNKVHMLERCREDDSIQLRKKNLSVAIKSLRF